MAVSKSKDKGTAAETAVVRYLNENSIDAVRNPSQGAKDKGDVNLLRLPIVIEVKNCITMKLAEWVKEAQTERDNAAAESGVVWHKKKGTTDPAKWYVTMTGQDFINLLSYVKEHYVPVY